VRAAGICYRQPVSVSAIGVRGPRCSAPGYRWTRWAAG